MIEVPKSVANFELEGFIFHLYGKQKPVGGLSPIFLMVGAHNVIVPYLVMISSGVLGWLRVKLCLFP